MGDVITARVAFEVRVDVDKWADAYEVQPEDVADDVRRYFEGLRPSDVFRSADEWIEDDSEQDASVEIDGDRYRTVPVVVLDCGDVITWSSAAPRPMIGTSVPCGVCNPDGTVGRRVTGHDERRYYVGEVR